MCTLEFPFPSKNIHWEPGAVHSFTESVLLGADVQGIGDLGVDGWVGRCRVGVWTGEWMLFFFITFTVSRLLLLFIMFYIFLAFAESLHHFPCKNENIVTV